MFRLSPQQSVCHLTEGQACTFPGDIKGQPGCEQPDPVEDVPAHYRGLD